MADCGSKPISQLFNAKFSLAQMKCEAEILKMLAPLSIKELIVDLKAILKQCLLTPLTGRTKKQFT
jgi:hypothetical protein